MGETTPHLEVPTTMQEVLQLRTNVTAPLAQLYPAAPQCETGNIHTDATQAEAEQLVSEFEVYLKAVTEGAPGCCIDGRHGNHNEDGSPTELRPSVAGGPLVTAYAAAELAGWFASDDTSSLYERLNVVKEQLEAKSIVLGGHTDTKAEAARFINGETGKIFTGCGANDKAPTVVSNIYGEPAIMQALVGTLLGDSYDAKHMQFTDAAVVDKSFSQWNPKLVLDVFKDDTGHNVEILEDTHEEMLVVPNYVPNTTIDRDALFEATGKQVFCVDMWYIDKLAKALASGPDLAKQESELRHAMATYQIGTYLTLCDGSQPVATLQPA